MPWNSDIRHENNGNKRHEDCIETGIPNTIVIILTGTWSPPKNAKQRVLKICLETYLTTPQRTLLPPRGPLSLASMPGTQKGRGKGKIGHKPLKNSKKTVTTSNHLSEQQTFQQGCLNGMSSLSV